jgi:hypothetical protein
MALAVKKEYLMHYGKDHREGVEEVERRRA